ncbi:MAG: diguanylate cyclase [Actinomycetota bacterium]|nr:diguanylate cyclase [Actinomycetota bacterium]
MSFRGRLRVFFTIIVIVPMVAVAAVLYRLTADSETGKVDAGIAAGLRTAFALYDISAERAEPGLRAVAANRSFVDGLAAGGPRARAALRRGASLPGVVRVAFRSEGSQQLLSAGREGGIAAAGAPLVDRQGRRLGTLALSVTPARAYTNQLHKLTGLEVGLTRGRLLADTRGGAPSVPAGGGDFELGREDYRGRTDRFREVLGPPVTIAVYDPSDELTGAVGNSRLLIGGIILTFLLLALASSVFVVRALQDQIGSFLDAARRLGKGDFKHPVPTHGGDEFALLGREFNSMSEQLEAKIEELDRNRRELEETIRRVGAAFASGLDPQGIFELTLDTAIDACEADGGRALPLAHGRIEAFRRGSEAESTTAALAAAEGVALRGDGGALPIPGRAAEARSRGAHALAVPIRAPHRGREQVGLISIARGREFTREERELFEYLAGQAAVSIENADLHETVQRQAVTDELTGLSNLRELQSTLDREIERSRRSDSPLGLVMLDIDNFKQVNDAFGHQQGDQVLVQVGRVLRELSRDIDEPARYGGEELAVITPETDTAGAAQLAERMRVTLEGLRIPRLDGQGELQITASFGVASLPDTAWDKDSLIAAADGALYRAKHSGKNRVESAGSLAAPR